MDGKSFAEAEPGVAVSLSSRALWVIDRNLDRCTSLGEIAAACSVSRHHLAHAFGAAVGTTVIDYVRARRLSEAAQALAAGAGDILDLALASGYGSHEAFSRAFRAKFGSTPEAVRRRGSTEGLALTAPIRLRERERPAIDTPRFRDGAAMLAVGLRERRRFGDVTAITALWRRFGPEAAAIENQAHASPIGIVSQVGEDGGLDYACAMPVRDVSAAPPHLARLAIPAQRYAVFRHTGHVSTIDQTYEAILDDWLPAAGRTLADGPSLEWHASAFDPATGEGGLELWLPVAD